jgi:hypothetical protein
MSRSAASAGASVASSRHGGLSSNRPLPFMRNGESSVRTSNSNSSADFAGNAAASR